MDPSIHDHALDFDSPPATREQVALARYLSGECSPEEAAQVRAWITSDPERQRMVEQAKDIWHKASAPTMQWDTNRVWHAVQQRRTADHSVHPKRRLTVSAKHVYIGAATIVMCALVAVGVVTLGRSSGPANHSIVENAQSASGRVFATRRGQRSIVRLPDGTEMILAAESRLRVPERYGQAHRNVYLEGTAQFSVQHDPAKPFVVHTRFGETRDLATKFVVSAYPSDTLQRVVVTEGRVASVGRRNTQAPLVLNPGEMGTLNVEGAADVQRRVDVGLYTAWTEGELRFASTPLQDVATALERWYDVTIEIGDTQLARVPLTVSIGKGTVDDAVRMISTILNIQSMRQGSHIRLVKETVR